MSIVPLKASQLRHLLDPQTLPFNDTTEVEASRDLIGQQRAVEAIAFGLRIQLDGYNIFMCGESGEGKTRYALESTQRAARDMPVPDDWCYVYNFEDANQPQAIRLPAGKGRTFKKDMEEFVRIIEQEIIKAFDGEDYDNERTRIIKQFKDKKDALVMELSQEAANRAFKVRMTNSGIYFMPVIADNPISEEEFGELDEETKIKITQASEELQTYSADIIRRIREVELEAEETIREWENQIALFAVGMHMDDLRDKYVEYPLITAYLDLVKTDILSHIDNIRRDEMEGDDDETPNPFQMMMKKSSDDDTLKRYRVNLLVDNSRLHGAPVILDYNPTYPNIIGRCEFENEFGAMTTDFMKVKPGLFHQANGGFLILQATDLLSNPQAFEAVKRTLKTRQITIEGMKDQMGLASMSGLRPESIPVNVKFILIGSTEIYQLLYNLDRDFKKLFKIKAEFDDMMKWDEDNITRMAQFIAAFCIKEGVLHFDRTGVSEVIRYCSWLVQDQMKLTTCFSDIVNILCESGTWAAMDGASLVKSLHVKKAIRERLKRSSKYDEELREMYVDGTLMVDTDGAVVGQINGLAVLDMGDYMFGKPSRITAVTYMGKAGIVDIEREVETGGMTHTKGVLILNGYIGDKFAQDIPLSLTASICFEQLYSGVEGDSASSTELYAILSSLSGLPICQGIAVTGSVNQHGDIQPIGGATQKIEGFFELCRERGLNGRQGVMIPHQNVRNLVLNDDVVDAVEAGLFNIWPIRTVDEGITLLTGVEAGKKQADGTFPAGTVNDLVSRKLRMFAETVARYSNGRLE